MGSGDTTLGLRGWRSMAGVEVEGQWENVLGVFPFFRWCFMEAVAARGAAG